MQIAGYRLSRCRLSLQVIQVVRVHIHNYIYKRQNIGSTKGDTRISSIYNGSTAVLPVHIILGGYEAGMFNDSSLYFSIKYLTSISIYISLSSLLSAHNIYLGIMRAPNRKRFPMHLNT